MGFTDFKLKGKSLLEYTNLFSTKKRGWQSSIKIFSAESK